MATDGCPADRSGRLPTGHRYWYGFPAAANLPVDRGGLTAGGLSSSAEDMARYLSIYLNHGRYGPTALISPAGAAELHRAGVATGIADTLLGQPSLPTSSSTSLWIVYAAVLGIVALQWRR